MLAFFDNLTDPRVERTKLHALKDIIGLTICAVLSGCEDWEEIEIYGQHKQQWLKQFLALPNGIPSHDTINRVFASLNPTELRDCFIDWVQSVAVITEGRVVSIDGKRMCNSGTHGKKSFVHMVSAWCNTNNMVLAQVKTEEKSNEITAIPALLDLLMLEGAIVTIDAMGCQKEIAATIVSAKADYVLAVKQNQGFLLDDIVEAFANTEAQPSHTTLEKSHGRIEKRTCHVIDDIDWQCRQTDWSGVQSLVKIETQRTVLPGGIPQSEQRFYLSSLKGGPEQFNEIVRQHWGIENKVHWTLDVTFKEDLSTKQAGNAAENFSIITKIALNLLKNNNTRKTSIKKKRLICSFRQQLPREHCLQTFLDAFALFVSFIAISRLTSQTMNRTVLASAIRKKKSVLCVGLDTDLSKIPPHLLREEDPAFAFNKAIIDATCEFAVAYKINTAFYEAQGIDGWKTLQRTLEYIPDGIFTIADAKRGDIGNTSEQYARTFFYTYPFDSVTVAPYMGEDSVKPFLQFEDKWAVVLGLTSNAGSADFQLQTCGDEPLYEKVLKTVSAWGSADNTMFVIGATREDQLKHVRSLLPGHFFLIPGVGAQGGDVATVCRNTLNEDGGILINVSRGIIYAGSGVDFSAAVAAAGRSYQRQMEEFL